LTMTMTTMLNRRERRKTGAPSKCAVKRRPVDIDGGVALLGGRGMNKGANETV